MLGIPPEELWRLIPGATADDVNRWVQAKQEYQAKDVVKNAVASALASQPSYANVTLKSGGGPGGEGGIPSTLPVELPAGTPSTVSETKGARTVGQGAPGVH